MVDFASYGYNSSNFQKYFPNKTQTIYPTLKEKLFTHQILITCDYHFLDDHSKPSALSKIEDLVYSHLIH